jgi:signal transduction histidine kinase
VITVRDNGPGYAGPAPLESSGVGLRNTAERLQELYGSAHVFTIRSDPEGGTVAEIVLPFHTDPIRLAAGEAG